MINLGKFNSMVGRLISQIDEHDGQVTLAFKGGGHLALFNDYEFNGAMGGVGALCGRKVLAVRIVFQWFEIEFSGGMTLTVNLGENGFVGPEAMAYLNENNELTVWQDPVKF